MSKQNKMKNKARARAAMLSSPVEQRRKPWGKPGTSNLRRKE